MEERKAYRVYEVKFCEAGNAILRKLSFSQLFYPSSTPPPPILACSVVCAYVGCDGCRPGRDVAVSLGGRDLRCRCYDALPMAVWRPSTTVYLALHRNTGVFLAIHRNTLIYRNRLIYLQYTLQYIPCNPPEYRGVFSEFFFPPCESTRLPGLRRPPAALNLPHNKRLLFLLHAMKFYSYYTFEFSKRYESKVFTVAYALNISCSPAA